MPKEVVYGQERPFDEESGARSTVEVRWDRETGYFQIATRCVGVDGESYFPEHMSEPLKKAGIAHGYWRPEGEENPPYVILFSEGMFVDLDRRGINDLIRNLRRARDQAFGKDE